MVKKMLGVGGESSMTLVQVGGIFVLIDTAFINEGNISRANLDRNARHVATAFERYNRKLEDVEEIFITHWHHDHFGNIRLFPKAIIRFAGLDRQKVERTLVNFDLPNECAEIPLNMEWRPGLTVMATPGHNAHHHSVVITFERFTLVAAGDAIVSQSYYDHGTVWPYNSDFLSEEVAKKSMAKIRDVADIIIPGHGHPFEKYLYSDATGSNESEE